MSKRLFIWLIPICFWACGNGNTTKQETTAPVQTPSTKPVPQKLEDSFEPEIEDIERTEWQNPDYILNFLGNLKDKVVADIGAGSGYFTFKLARSAEKVIALDIDPKALEYIESQKEIVGDWSNNIEPRLTPPDVPNLLADEVDLVLIVNTYSYIPNKENYFPRLLSGMKPGGRLVIVDFKKGDIPVGPADEFKADPKDVRSSLRKASFRKVTINQESLEYQYIITAEKK